MEEAVARYVVETWVLASGAYCRLKRKGQALWPSWEVVGSAFQRKRCEIGRQCKSLPRLHLETSLENEEVQAAKM